MYLTRVVLDARQRSVWRLLASPSRIHGLVESAFPGARRRNLWRVDNLNGGPCLLILSEERPELTAAAEKTPGGLLTWETRDYTPLLERIRSGGLWQFRLTANPTVSTTRPGERGKVKACPSVPAQEQWLLARAEGHGFSLAEDAFRVTESSWHQFSKESGKVVLRGVSFEGLLTVSDAARFREALVSGIGRGKAYGMGLLTVMRPGGS